MRLAIRSATRRGILLLTVLATVTWLVARRPPEVEESPVSHPDVKLNYALYDFSGRLLNDRGEVNLEIRSPELRNDAESGVGAVDAPEIRIRRLSDQWLITAESAIISSDREVVTLTGEVEITRRSLPGEEWLFQANSSNVVLNVTPRTAHSETAVSIRERGDRVDAVGMNLDMSNETYELLNDVRARYQLP